MANALYNSFKDDVLGGLINLSSDTIKVALINTGTYTFSQSHTRFNNVTGQVGSSATLGTKTISGGGIFDAADSTFTAVSGSNVGALIIYKDTGTASTSPLIAYIDTVSAGLPVTPNGGDISITWDNGTNKIFKL